MVALSQFIRVGQTLHLGGDRKEFAGTRLLLMGACSDAGTAVPDVPDIVISGPLKRIFPSPEPLGDPAAFASLGTIAAPLLAGFAVTVIMFAAQTPKSFRYPSLVELTAGLAVLALLTALQCTVHAQRYAVTPPDLLNRYAPDDRLQIVLLAYEEVRRCWSARANHSYNAGIVCFFVTLALVLVPASGVAKGVAMPGARWAAVTIAGLGALFEVGWMFCARIITTGRLPAGIHSTGRYVQAAEVRAKVRENFWKGLPPPQDTTDARHRFLIDSVIPTYEVHLVAILLKHAEGKRT